jgi:hypothetical protein
MTRDERRNELVRLLKSDLPKLLELYRRAVGAASPTGILGSQLVKAILDKEFSAKPQVEIRGRPAIGHGFGSVAGQKGRIKS